MNADLNDFINKDPETAARIMNQGMYFFLLCKVLDMSDATPNMGYLYDIEAPMYNIEKDVVLLNPEWISQPCFFGNLARILYFVSLKQTKDGRIMLEQLEPDAVVKAGDYEGEMPKHHITAYAFETYIIRTLFNADTITVINGKCLQETVEFKQAYNEIEKQYDADEIYAYANFAHFDPRNSCGLYKEVDKA